MFIDGANLYATTKKLGIEIDYQKLLQEFRSRGNLVRAFYYTAVIEDQEFSSIRPLIDWLDYSGYPSRRWSLTSFVDKLMSFSTSWNCKPRSAGNRKIG